MRLALPVLVLAGCIGAVHPVYHPDVVQVVDTESDKAVEVVSDERIPEHEPRKVPDTAVASALIASGMFLDEDARTLAGPIAERLATMDSDEAIRIVGWAADAPRYYYVVVHHGRLEVIYYAGSRYADDYSAVIPTDATPIHAPEEPAAAPPPAPAPPPDAGAVSQAAPPPAPHPARHHAHAPIPGYTPITEAEARRQLRELDDALSAGLISAREHREKRKQVLSRL